MLTLPSIIENNEVYDLPSKLFQQNIITIFGEINQEMAYSTISQLLYLDSTDTKEPINIYINSEGGVVYDGLAIIDVINSMNKKVNTICTGIAMSMGASILASGTGVRKALPNSRIMIHSVSSGTQGVVHDMEVSMKETLYLQDKLMKILSDTTKGKTSFKEIKKLTQRDKYLSPKEAKDLGFIDEII